MQTFLPYENFKSSAECLDNKRLGKQLVECQQILKAIQNPLYGWQNHPAVKMWRGYESGLVMYAEVLYVEWQRRFKRQHKSGEYMRQKLTTSYQTPKWLGNPDFHAAHRSNLLRKSPTWYSQFGWSEPNNLPYIWPVL